MEPGNPARSDSWPYVTALIVIPLVSILGVVVLLVTRPDKDNASLVTQILGFGVTITVATLAFLKSADTREVVNSRMDEFKRTMQLASDAAVLTAHAEGKQEGRDSANERTDVLASKIDAAHDTLKTHDQWERDRVKP
jgi:hypothetical protein